MDVADFSIDILAITADAGNFVENMPYFSLAHVLSILFTLFELIFKNKLVVLE